LHHCVYNCYSTGAILVKINASQADFIKKDFEIKIKGINQYGIFANNFKVALGMRMYIENHSARITSDQ
jgi:hypothetical protein